MPIILYQDSLEFLVMSCCFALFVLLSFSLKTLPVDQKTYFFFKELDGYIYIYIYI